MSPSTHSSSKLHHKDYSDQKEPYQDHRHLKFINIDPLSNVYPDYPVSCRLLIRYAPPDFFGQCPTSVLIRSDMSFPGLSVHRLPVFTKFLLTSAIINGVFASLDHIPVDTTYKAGFFRKIIAGKVALWFDKLNNQLITPTTAILTCIGLIKLYLKYRPAIVHHISSKFIQSWQSSRKTAAGVSSSSIMSGILHRLIYLVKIFPTCCAFPITLFRFLFCSTPSLHQPKSLSPLVTVSTPVLPNTSFFSHPSPISTLLFPSQHFSDGINSYIQHFSLGQLPIPTFLRPFVVSLLQYAKQLYKKYKHVFSPLQTGFQFINNIFELLPSLNNTRQFVIIAILAYIASRFAGWFAWRIRSNLPAYFTLDHEAYQRDIVAYKHPPRALFALPMLPAELFYNPTVLGSERLLRVCQFQRPLGPKDSAKRFGVTFLKQGGAPFTEHISSHPKTLQTVISTTPAAAAPPPTVSFLSHQHSEHHGTHIQGMEQRTIHPMTPTTTTVFDTSNNQVTSHSVHPSRLFVDKSNTTGHTSQSSFNKQRPFSSSQDISGIQIFPPFSPVVAATAAATTTNRLSASLNNRPTSSIDDPIMTGTTQHQHHQRLGSKDLYHDVPPISEMSSSPYPSHLEVLDPVHVIFNDLTTPHLAATSTQIPGPSIQSPLLSSLSVMSTDGVATLPSLPGAVIATTTTPSINNNNNNNNGGLGAAKNNLNKATNNTNSNYLLSPIHSEPSPLTTPSSASPPAHGVFQPVDRNNNIPLGGPPAAVSNTSPFAAAATVTMRSLFDSIHPFLRWIPGLGYSAVIAEASVASSAATTLGKIHSLGSIHSTKGHETHAAGTAGNVRPHASSSTLSSIPPTLITSPKTTSIAPPHTHNNVPTEMTHQQHNHHHHQPRHSSRLALSHHHTNTRNEHAVPPSSSSSSSSLTSLPPSNSPNLEATFNDWDHKPRPIMFICNHTVMGADMLVFQWVLTAQFNLYARGIAHLGHFNFPGWSHFLRFVGAVVGTRELTSAVMSHGYPIFIFPGGGREVLRKKSEPQYDLFWQQRLGFAKLAIQHNAIIIPVGFVGNADNWCHLGDISFSWLYGNYNIVDQTVALNNAQQLTVQKMLIHIRGQQLLRLAPHIVTQNDIEHWEQVQNMVLAQYHRLTIHNDDGDNGNVFAHQYSSALSLSDPFNTSTDNHGIPQSSSVGLSRLSLGDVSHIITHHPVSIPPTPYIDAEHPYSTASGHKQKTSHDEQHLSTSNQHVSFITPPTPFHHLANHVLADTFTSKSITVTPRAAMSSISISSPLRASAHDMAAATAEPTATTTTTTSTLTKLPKIQQPGTSQNRSVSVPVSFPNPNPFSWQRLYYNFGEPIDCAAYQGLQDNELACRHVRDRAKIGLEYAIHEALTFREHDPDRYTLQRWKNAINDTISTWFR